HRSLITGLLPVRISLGEPDDRPRAAPPPGLPPNAGSSRSRRFAFAAFPAAIPAHSPRGPPSPSPARAGTAPAPSPGVTPPPPLRLPPRREQARPPRPAGG